MKKFRRSEMHLKDLQVRVFNGRGWVCPIEYSTTGILEPNFATFHSFYMFWFDFLDVESNTIIRDNVSKIWKKSIEQGEGTDPLGANFRDGFEKLIVNQDEYWQPGKYERNAIFNKKIKDSYVNIAIKTLTVVDHLQDKVYLHINLKNRDDKDKLIKLLPNHEITRKNTGKIENISLNEIKVGDGRTIFIESNIQGDKEGYPVSIKKNSEQKIIFGFNFFTNEPKKLSVISNKLFQDLQKAISNIDKRFEKLQKALPIFRSEYKPFENLYQGSITTLNECMWERDDFLSKPFWSVGSWLFTINWDLAFSAKAVGLIDKKSLLQAIWNPILYGRLKSTWVSWLKNKEPSQGGIFYIQELPSTISILEDYLRYTNDFSVLLEKKEGKTLLEWLKTWFEEVILPYWNKDNNLIDVKDDTEILVEIRTDGYDNVVPNTNILIADTLYKIAKYCKITKDKDEAKYFEKAQLMSKSINDFLWDEKNWWFSNLDAQGQKQNIYTYHLFDTLNCQTIDYEKKMKLISHIKEGEFLGKYGFYSISKRDLEHHDRIDADWGGGGQFAGMPGKIATNCFKLGANYKGHEILKKLARWTSVFPYQPQNARTEQGLIDLSSMAIQVSAGASIEALIFGLFGIELTEKEIAISPNYNEVHGQTSFENLKIDNLSISVYLDKDKFKVMVNGKLVEEHFHGEKVVIKRT